MSKYKILLFSDLHLGLLNKYISNAFNIYKELIQEIFSFNYDKWIFLGDLVDNIKKKISLQEVEILYTFILHKQKNLAFLYGNHDLLYPSFFNDKSYLVKEPMYTIFPIEHKIVLNYYKNIKTLFIFISYISPSKKNEVYEYLKKNLKLITNQNLDIKNIIAFTHLDYTEILPLQEGYSFDKLTELLHSTFTNVNNILFFNGHYHEKGKYNNSYGKLINIGSSLMNNKSLSLSNITVNDIPSVVFLTIDKNDFNVEYTFLPLQHSILHSQISTYADLSIFKNKNIKNSILLEYQSEKIDYSLVDEIKNNLNTINILIKKLDSSISDNISQLPTINEQSFTNLSYKVSQMIKNELLSYIEQSKEINEKMRNRLISLFNNQLEKE